MKKTKVITDWVNLTECAQYMRISKETLYRLIYKKKIPKNRVGRRYLFNKLEIDAAIKKGIK